MRKGHDINDIMKCTKKSGLSLPAGKGRVGKWTCLCRQAEINF